MEASRINQSQETSPSSEPVSVNQVLDRFESEYMPNELAPRTQLNYAYHLAELRRVFGHRIVDELRPKDFGDFLSLKGRGKVNRVRTIAVLSAAFTQAVSHWYMVERNVLRDVKRPRFRPRDRLILDAEFTAVRATASPRVQCAMDLALLTGQRQGDLIALKWSDILDDEIHLQQQKTGKRRAIGITPDLEQALDRCWLLPDRADHILTRKGGGRYTSEGFRAVWQRTMNRAMRLRAVLTRFTFHDIRAMSATKHTDPEGARRLLGHTTVNMTQRVYRRGVEHVPALQLT